MPISEHSLLKNHQFESIHLPESKKTYTKAFIISLIVAIIGALLGVLFVYFYTYLGRFAYEVAFGGAGKSLSSLTHQFPTFFWPLLIILPLGGLIVGIATKLLMPGGLHAGFPNILMGIHKKKGKVSVREGFGVAIVAGVGIASGASVGRFGPGVHIGSALSTWFGDLFSFTREGRLMLMGAGIAATVSAMFGMPLAVGVFVLEALFRNFSVRLFAPILTAAFIGSLVNAQFFGAPLFVSNLDMSTTNPLIYVAIVALAMLSVLGTLLYRKTLLNAGKIHLNLFPASAMWYKPALAGVVLALIALVFPQTLGLSVPMIRSLVSGAFLIDWSMSTVMMFGLLILLFFAKLLAIFISFAGGFNGGVFAPSLALGSILGALVGLMFSHITGMPFNPIFVVLGAAVMTSLFFGAPIAMIALSAELSQNLSIVAPAALAVGVAHVIHQWILHGRSHFDPVLKNKGLSLATARYDLALEETKLGSLLNVAPMVPEQTDVAALKESFQKLALEETLFVVDAHNNLKGEVNVRALLMRDTGTALDVLSPAAMLTSNDSLTQVLAMFKENSALRSLAVVESTENPVLLGYVHATQILELEQKIAQAVQIENTGS